VPTGTTQPLRGENIIVFSSDDWASGLKTSKYHIASRLARDNRVLFVNSVGLRAPTASGRDLRRAFEKLTSFCRGPVCVPEGLHVYTPIVFPAFRSSPVVKALNALLLRAAIRTLQRSLGLWNPVVFSFMPTFNDVLGNLDERAVVYYCIDDLTGYDGVDKAWFQQEEERLLDLADCVIASSSELAAAFGERGHKAHYVPHGVDWALFRRAVEDDLPIPEDLRDIPHPRLGFYGFLSDEWVDYPLLKRLAAERPDWHIVLIGRPKAGMDMQAIVPEANIHYLGLKPFEDLPAYTRHFDVGLVPFCLSALTLHSNPLKVFEYLAGGLPVVTTDIPELRAHADKVHIARRHEEFLGLCEAALAENAPDRREQRSRAVESCSWDDRVREIGTIVNRAK